MLDIETTEYIKNLALFKGVSAVHLQAVVQDAEKRTFAAQDVVLQSGSVDEALYIIYQGQVKIVSWGYREREIVLNQFGPGQIFGEISLVNHAPRSTSVVALEAVEVVLITYDTFMQGLKQSPALTENFMGTMLERVRFSNLYIEKAIALTQAVAEGDYQAARRQFETERVDTTDLRQAGAARIGTFLAVFLKMIDGVKQREDYMKKQLDQHFEINIDTSKKDQEVENLAKRTFFYRVKSMADQMRERRKQRSDDK